MKNIKKTTLGILVASLAFGFSAFTNAKKPSTVLFNFLVQRTEGSFTQVNVSSPYEEPNYLACYGTSDRRCIYLVTMAGKANIPTLSSLGQIAYNSVQIDAYLAESPSPWIIVDPESSNAVYGN